MNARRGAPGPWLTLILFAALWLATMAVYVVNGIDHQAPLIIANVFVAASFVVLAVEKKE